MRPRRGKHSPLEYEDVPGEDWVWVVLANDRGRAKVDRADLDLIGQHKWCLQAGRRTNYVTSGHGLLHTLLVGCPGVDHINGDGLDNRRSNLRVATRSENGRNRPGVGRYKGVSLYRRTGRWRARIVLDHHETSLGYYDTAEEAARAYDTAARKLHGEFAWLNFPEVRSP